MAIPSYPGNFSARALDASDPVPEGFVLLDIREENEFVAGHAPGAVNLPMTRLQGRMDDLPDGKLILACRTGSRSVQAMDWLAQRGHRAWNLRDGMLAWRLAGFPVVRDDGTPGAII